jgi:hypothetical protein
MTRTDVFTPWITLHLVVSPSFLVTGLDSRNGTVNLIGHGRDRARGSVWTHEQLRQNGSTGDLGPRLEGLGPGGSISNGGEMIATEVKEAVDLVVGREKALRLPG